MDIVLESCGSVFLGSEKNRYFTINESFKEVLNKKKVNLDAHTSSTLAFSMKFLENYVPPNNKNGMPVKLIIENKDYKKRNPKKKAVVDKRLIHLKEESFNSRHSMFDGSRDEVNDLPRFSLDEKSRQKNYVFNFGKYFNKNYINPLSIITPRISKKSSTYRRQIDNINETRKKRKQKYQPFRKKFGFESNEDFARVKISISKSNSSENLSTLEKQIIQSPPTKREFSEQKQEKEDFIKGQTLIGLISFGSNHIRNNEGFF